MLRLHVVRVDLLGRELNRSAVEYRDARLEHGDLGHLGSVIRQWQSSAHIARPYWPRSLLGYQGWQGGGVENCWRTILGRFTLSPAPYLATGGTAFGDCAFHVKSP
jgi:hypothetical protein